MKKLGKIFVSGLLLTAMASGTACFGGGGETSDNIVADKYKITVACQTEMGEEEVLKVLKAAYEKKNPDVEIEIKTFSGEGFEQYMGGISANQSSSPNIIWTADTYHSQWDQFFTDLRPYYEASAETDYSLYYETMLDTASTNGTFKPTKNYTNPLGKFNREKDANSDGKEDYKNHSEYGLYYAPRDYNKPAILCNTHLFAEVDTVYEKVYKAKEEVAEMPAGYKTATARLQEIVAGTDWDELNDLYVFAKFVADKVDYIVANASAVDRRLGQEWSGKAVLNLFLDWEPTYTMCNVLGIHLHLQCNARPAKVAAVSKHKANRLAVLYKVAKGHACLGSGCKSTTWQSKCKQNCCDCCKGNNFFDKCAVFHKIYYTITFAFCKLCLQHYYGKMHFRQQKRHLNFKCL